MDNIPVSILKQGVDTLSGRISYLVDRSLATGILPNGLKTTLIHPIHKGGDKSRTDPALYHPVAILYALSEVQETVAKEDLQDNIRRNNNLWTRSTGSGRDKSAR
jgi:hypothetical protein